LNGINAEPDMVSERKGFERCAGCFRELIVGSDVTYWLEDGRIICYGCYQYAIAHQDDYQGTHCLVCGHPVQKIGGTHKARQKKFCDGYKEHDATQSMRKEPDCPRCTDKPMHRRTKTIKTKTTWRRQTIDICAFCGHTASFTESRCNLCGEIKKRIQKTAY